MFSPLEILLSALGAGILTSVVLAMWSWTRERSRFVLAGLTTFLGFAAWNFTLNATHSVPNFNHDAPVVGVSWADAGSGILAFTVTAREGHPIGFSDFLKYGLLVTVGSLLVSTAYIWLRHLL